MEKFRYYLQIGDELVGTNDSTAWSQWFENFENRKVDYTQINEDVYVSTVALGLDHSAWTDGPPKVFETMAFGVENEHMRRYSTFEDAKNGHREVVEEVKAHLAESDWKIDLDILN